jgi:hypothetical protein
MVGISHDHPYRDHVSANEKRRHTMTFRLSRNTAPYDTMSLWKFPGGCNLTTVEQIRNFELLRLAFFALKLRKLEHRQDIYQEDHEYRLHCSLLRHVIFQQMLTLTKLGGHSQAMQLIDTCRK